jgi:hypothetical protein
MLIPSSVDIPIYAYKH